MAKCKVNKLIKKKWNEKTKNWFTDICCGDTFQSADLCDVGETNEKDNCIWAVIMFVRLTLYDVCRAVG